MAVGPASRKRIVASTKVPYTQHCTVRRMLAWLGQRRLPKAPLLLGARARLRERKPIAGMGARGSPEHQLTA